MAKIQVKTKTAVGIALAVALVGTAGFVAGLYYYGQRINYISSKTNCNCPVCPVCPKCDTATNNAASDSKKETSPDTPSDSGNAELGFKMDTGYGNSITGIQSQSGGTNGEQFSETVTVVNTGSDAAGSFKVKVWFSPTSNITKYSELLYTWDVPGLAAGQSITKILTPLSFSGGPVHSYYYLVTKIDADNQVKEKNEASCGFPPGPTVGCNVAYGEFFIYR